MHLIRIIQWVIPFITLGLAQADDRSLALGLINQARAAQGVQPLTWNDNLASYAQYWANIMAAGQQPFSHAQGSYRPQQGETLFEYQSSQCDAAYDTPLQKAAQTWLAQASLYNGAPIADGHEPWLHWCRFDDGARVVIVHPVDADHLMAYSSVYVVDDDAGWLCSSLQHFGGVQGVRRMPLLSRGEHVRKSSAVDC